MSTAWDELGGNAVADDRSPADQPSSRAIGGASSTATSGWSLIAAVAVMIVCIAAGPVLLGDPDTQWHIAAGRWMLANGVLPQVDWLSHTFAGQRWIAKEWLSQIMLATAYAAGGWNGVAVLAALAVGAAFYLVMAHVERRAGPAAGVAAGMIALLFVAPTFVARPHVLAFPIVVAWVIALLRRAEVGGGPPWLALPLLTLWANVHAAFTVGIVIAAAFGLEALLRAERGTRFWIMLRWLAFGIGCIAAVAVSPYGIEPLLLNHTMASGNEAIPFLSEWRPLEAAPRSALLALVVVLAFVALAQRPWENAARLLLLGLLAVMAAKHQRFVMALGLVTPLLAGPALFALGRDIARRLDLFQSVSLFPTSAWLRPAACGLAVAAVLGAMLQPLAPPPAVAPIATLSQVPADVRSGRVYNSYDLGGFLANQGIPTFIDGRTDQLFLGGFISRVMTVGSGADPVALAALLDEYAVTWAIIGRRQTETRLFPRLTGWHLLHKDGAAEVWVRTGNRG